MAEWLRTIVSVVLGALVGLGSNFLITLHSDYRQDIAARNQQAQKIALLVSRYDNQIGDLISAIEVYRPNYCRLQTEYGPLESKLLEQKVISEKIFALDKTSPYSSQSVAEELKKYLMLHPRSTDAAKALSLLKALRERVSEIAPKFDAVRKAFSDVRAETIPDVTVYFPGFYSSWSALLTRMMGDANNEMEAFDLPSAFCSSRHAIPDSRGVDGGWEILISKMVKTDFKNFD